MIKSNKRTILIVEDEMDMRFFLTALLKTSGYETITAQNGRQGLQKAAESIPDLIIMDVMMPEQGGALMYLEIKKDKQLKDIPVIMLSAVNKTTFHHYLNMINTKEKVAIPLPSAYIEKPPAPDYLLKVIKGILHHE